MTIVNMLTGEVLMENAKDYEDLLTIGYEYNEDIDCICKDGKNHAVADLADAREMSYREYKNNYSNCRTKKNSYNADKKTIVVYVGWFDKVSGEEMK